MAQIIVSIQDRSGIFSRVSVTIIRNKIKILNTKRSKLSNGLIQYKLDVDSSANLPTLAQKLKQINGVESISIVETDTPAKPARTVSRQSIAKSSPLSIIQTPQNALTIARQLEIARPNIVGVVREYSLTLSAEEASSKLYDAGFQYGNLSARKNNMSKTRAIPIILEHVVMPEISNFSMADWRNNKISIILCPFCRENIANIEHCSFLHGLIAGIFDQYISDATITVSEQSSQVNGASECVFIIKNI